MQNKEKCLHATPLSETVLIPTIQIREGRKSKEKKKKERNEGGKETKRGEGRLEGKGEGGWEAGGGGEEEGEEEEQEGRDSTLKCFVLDLYVDRFKRIKIKVKHDFVCLKI